VRAALESVSLEELLRELEAGDPATFARIDRRNARRVVRALEVIRLTGRPYSEQRTGWGTAPRLPEGWTFVALAREPADLRRRMDARVDRMLGEGLVAETQALLARGLAGNRTALQAIGYRQVAEHLRGERSLPETVALVKQKTWQFARRQMTWLRRQLPVAWVEAGAGERADALAGRVRSLGLRDGGA
jgi:tRNA dimethylallyltransferase